ncbi:hypothetical protein [Solirubrobacter soli]|uniref:hypothetical protein n=1 Tax=Solirubrobacter soli TaxID=363832 RepID=UPI000428CD2C|nr:hypothetical protein [Solirubrobacter soli]
MKKLRFSGRAAIVCSLILAIGVPSVAMGFGEGRNLLLGKRNPSSNPALALSTETEIIANNSTYGTRQSNKKDGDGGGAIYGCRSATGNEPCIKSVNLKGGRAFEFNTVGPEGGRIETGSTTGAPFTTNATGVATGLNADRVDGKEAADFASAADLKTTQDSITNGFFTAIVTNGNTTATGRGVGTGQNVSQTGNDYTVTFAKDVSKCSYTATPVGPTPQALAVQAASDPTKVVVNATAPTSFHLQVIC